MHKLLALILAVYGCLLFAAAGGGSSRGERPEVKWGTPTVDYLERHGYILGRPGHFTPWVMEHRTAASFMHKADRSDFSFYADDDTPKEFRATLQDYEGAGYDRGHMVPAGNCTGDPMAMRDCYRLSNMMPQTPELNRGEWKRLEEHVRQLASQPGAECWIVTGPCWPASEVGHVSFDAIGFHEVWAPKACFKAVLTQFPGNKVTVKAWMLPNTGNPPAFEKCEVSVDAIEAAAGLDLFAGLPDDLEEKLER